MRGMQTTLFLSIEVEVCTIFVSKRVFFLSRILVELLLVQFNFNVLFYSKFSVGECKLENMRTLCVACHSDVTKQQCAERHSTRIKAKKKLKAIMTNLKHKGTETIQQVCSKSSGLFSILLRWLPWHFPYGKICWNLIN